jgi:hypothetical protein
MTWIDFFIPLQAQKYSLVDISYFKFYNIHVLVQLNINLSSFMNSFKDM